MHRTTHGPRRRARARARGFAASLSRHFGSRRAFAAELRDSGAHLAHADGLVHDTPTGMAAHPGLPVPAVSLHSGLWVAEVVCRPLETELLAAARAAGCRVLDGGGMAVFQAADALRLFAGREPESSRMLADFASLAEAPGGTSVSPRAA